MAAVFALPGTSYADAYAATVDSVGPMPAGVLTGGSTLSVPFTASDTGGSGIMQVELVFTNPRVGGLAQGIDAAWSLWPADEGPASLNDVATKELSPWVASGTWTLARVIVHDFQNNQRDYYPDHIDTYPDDGTDPADNIDWSLNFTVDNPGEDITKPVLTDVHVFESEVSAGEPVLDLYSAADDNSGLAVVSVVYQSPRGTYQYVYNDDPATVSLGPASWLVPLTAYGGTYTVLYLDVYDRAGNIRQYGLGGDADDNVVDLHAADFTVDPVAEDSTMPVLNSLQMRSNSSLHPGDDVAIATSVSDDSSGVVQILAYWRDSEAHEFLLQRQCRLGLSTNTLTERLPRYAAHGIWTLQRVELWDGQGNLVDYLRDGTIRKQPASGAGATTHDFDFSAYDFSVSDGDPGPPASRDLFACSAVPDITLGTTAPVVEAGDTVTVDAQITHAGGPVSEPVVAMYTKDSTGTRLLGVKRGDSTGSVSTTVQPSETFHLWARFFGKARGNVTDAATSNERQVRVVRAASLGVVRTNDGQLIRQSPGGPQVQLGGDTRTSPAVVAHALTNYYFEASHGVVMVRDDGRRWQRFGRPAGGCHDIGAAVSGAKVRAVCVSRVGDISWSSGSLGRSLPTAARWHHLGRGAVGRPAVWVTADHRLHVAASTAAGAIRMWTVGVGSRRWPMRCSAPPAVVATASATYLACPPGDGNVRLWTWEAGSWSSRLIDGDVTGPVALNRSPGQGGTVLLWATNTAHHLAVRSIGAGGVWQDWPQTVGSGVAATIGYV